MSLLSSGVTQPLVTSAAFVLTRLHSFLTRFVGAKLVVALMGGITALLWIVAGSLSESIYLVAAFSLVVTFSNTHRLARLPAALFTATMVLVLALNTWGEPLIRLKPLVPIFDFSDLRGEDVKIARAAAENTPIDALFVTPPSLGLLRTVGRRAMVVDFEAVPFQNWAMREWRERIRSAYGDVVGGGFTALEALERNYRTITDAHLSRLANRYGATHAILYANTPSLMPVVFVNETYRIVRLTPLP